MGIYEEATTKSRRRRTIAGEGMLTPTKELSDIDGQGTLVPKRTRVAIDYPLVRERPELFRPADPSDRATHRALLILLKRHKRAVDRELANRSRRTLPRVTRVIRRLP
jgi:hypothetical protein